MENLILKVLPAEIMALFFIFTVGGFIILWIAWTKFVRPYMDEQRKLAREEGEDDQKISQTLSSLKNDIDELKADKNRTQEQERANREKMYNKMDDIQKSIREDMEKVRDSVQDLSKEVIKCLTELLQKK